MIRGDRDQDTICAVSTPHGVGGVSLIRISGPSSFSFIRKLAPSVPNNPETHRVYFSSLFNFDHTKKIDEVLITTFHQGKSYTGDETVEISCHGNPVIASWILKELILCGARTADRGEFTFRAFMNGNIDLIQAEGVLGLIESQSQRSAEQALSQLKGGLSQEIHQIEENLLWCLARIEAGIDFSSEDIEVIDSRDLQSRIEIIKSVTQKLFNSYQAGKMIHDGIHVVIVGRPNVGKSSLLNLFSREEKAIVTDLAGTTRDLIESDILHKGYKIKFIDTAGLHEADNKVEKIGIEKTKKTIETANLVFFIYDLTEGLTSQDKELLHELDPQKTLIIGNKLDLLSEKEIEASVCRLNIPQNFSQQEAYFISTKDEKFILPIYKYLDRFIETHHFEDHSLIFQSRHFENLSKIRENIDRAQMLLHSKASYEFISLELKEALLLVHETLGKRFDDQIMDRVFKEFCIGK